jgi:hypothetical protein
MTAVNAILFFRVMLSFDKVNRLLAHIFKPIPFKGITIEISALILGKGHVQSAGQSQPGSFTI